MQMPKGKLAKAQQDEAQRVLGFDVYIHNPDRRAVNPNLDRQAHRFGLYDHELAMGFRKPGMLIGSSSPETDPCRDIVQQHCFYQALKAKRGVSMERFRRSLEALSDRWFAELEAAAPTEWLTNGCRDQLTTILGVLRRRRDHAAAWLNEVEECLT
jgi:hypothetical protein